MEANDAIYAWYDPIGKDPAWDVPIIPEMRDDGYLVVQRVQRTVRTSWQEVAENGIDLAHFPTVHGTEKVECTVRIDGPIRRVRRSQHVPTPGGPVTAVIESTEYGPGIGVVEFAVDFGRPSIDQFLMITELTPIDATSLHLRLALLVQRRDDPRRQRILGTYLLRDLVRQLDQDIPIWENKRYLTRPALVQGDGPIRAHREWAKQFYSLAE